MAADHHRTRRYITAALQIRAAATADPHARCWRCNQTLQQHPTHALWQAGHTIDGSTTWTLWTDVRNPPPPGDYLAAEASTCNASAGATAGNRKREPHTEQW